MDWYTAPKKPPTQMSSTSHFSNAFSLPFHANRGHKWETWMVQIVIQEQKITVGEVQKGINANGAFRGEPCSFDGRGWGAARRGRQGRPCGAAT